jgi:hypothetical protein
MTHGGAYGKYWERKRLLAGGVPSFPVLRWWETDELSEVERVCFDAVKDAKSLLDVGAGDLHIKRKFEAAGFGAEYHTQDIGPEYPHTYRDLTQVTRQYDAILCLDVIEHLQLDRGLELLDRLVELLAPGGVLVVQTPNGRCIRSPFGWDMTHLHIYNLDDLWAYITAAGLETKGYRVVFGPARRSPLQWLRFALGAITASRLLGADYADNVVVIGRKAAPAQ